MLYLVCASFVHARQTMRGAVAPVAEWLGAHWRRGRLVTVLIACVGRRRPRSGPPKGGLTGANGAIEPTQASSGIIDSSARSDELAHGASERIPRGPKTLSKRRAQIRRQALDAGFEAIRRPGLLSLKLLRAIPVVRRRVIPALLKEELDRYRPRPQPKDSSASWNACKALTPRFSSAHGSGKSASSCCPGFRFSTGHSATTSSIVDGWSSCHGVAPGPGIVT